MKAIVYQAPPQFDYSEAPEWTLVNVNWLALAADSVLVTVEPMRVRRKNTEVAEVDFLTAQLRWW